MKHALLLLGLLFASPSASALSIQRHVLANGLTVILYEDHKLPMVTSYAWYKVGSRNDGPGKSGFAHLFEHFMFEGSEHVPNGYHMKLAFDNGGVANASTSFDRTDYFFTMPSNHLEELLRVEADRMGFLEKGMTQQSFEKERAAVLNEKHQGDDQPYYAAYEKLFRNSYPKGHPYANLPIGSDADLNAASVADAKAFRAVYYWPNNAVLVVAGDHDSTRTLALVNKYFGTLKRGPTPPAAADIPGSPSKAREHIVDGKAQEPLLIMAWRVPGLNQPGHREIEVLGSLLAGGRASPLVDKLKVRERKVLDIGAEMQQLEHGDIFMISAKPAPGVTLKVLEKIIDAEISALLSAPLDGERLKGMAKRLETARLNALQNAHDLASALASGEAIHQDPLSFEKEIAAVRAMQPDAVRRAGRQYLAPANRTLLTISPKEAK
jgi:zinc protease